MRPEPPLDSNHPERSESERPDPERRDRVPNPNSSASNPSPKSLQPSPRQPARVRQRRQNQPTSQPLRSPQSSQPLLRSQTIKTLKGTIRLLEWTVTRLETDSPQPVAAGSSPQASDRGLRPARAPWQQVQRWWNRFLRGVRSLLPAALNRQLSNQALTGVIAGILLFILWINGDHLLHSRLSPAAPAITIVPSPALSPAPVPSLTPSPVLAPSPTPTPLPTASASPVPVPSLSPSPTPTPSPTAELPQPISSPSPTVAPSSPAEAPEVAVPSPPPLPPLTPEQTILARIQAEITEVTAELAPGLVESVQANFRGSLLTLTTNASWNELAQTQQAQLANHLWQQAQQLNFSKLELKNRQGTLLARSPVVGSDMVILGDPLPALNPSRQLSAPTDRPGLAG